jgi:alkylhydroperoxidase family enzyme
VTESDSPLILSPMPNRISRLERDEMTPEMQRAFDEQVRSHGRMTNMKKTLAHSKPAFDALMSWYDLRDEVSPFLGHRLTNLLAHAVSAETDCLICSTFFRRILIEEGENPDSLKLTEKEETVVDFGRQLAQNPNRVSDELFVKLSKFFDQKQIVAITAFGSLMIATNVFNNALKVELDEYLVPFRKK